MAFRENAAHARKILELRQDSADEDAIEGDKRLDGFDGETADALDEQLDEDLDGAVRDGGPQ